MARSGAQVVGGQQGQRPLGMRQRLAIMLEQHQHVLAGTGVEQLVKAGQARAREAVSRTG
ncbi:hypothetical protein NM04_09800 [Massilia aurea]|uniref:Uncharacterized protein n=1 Tax=Massilia aurea TaxID=373040 RepID=A0A422QLR0_9BURK|nr:hypothetical protein NM04_09800 [Massilia aurea]